MKIRLAQRGEGKAVASLLEAVLGSTPGGLSGCDLATGIDRLGGRISVPYGHTRALVAADGEEILGMCNLAPAIRLADESAELGPAGQQRLARRVAELDIIAVSPSARRRGVARQLLRTAQTVLAASGCTQLLAQIHQDNAPALAWAAQQGFALPEPGGLIVLRFGGREIGIDALTGGGYRQAHLTLI
ncbi:GNAT family N-acetyltransferase [Streptomyces sp. NPDC005562]|uniref:GNAT family N-acetyltransferase n=1 Tax=Streptomyces sp. NPDC005562 TaxID=3154890 RepID=UPI0033BF9E7E